MEPDASGDPRLDALVPLHLKSQRVVRHLLQRQIPVQGGGEPRAGAKRGNNDNSELTRLREKVRRLEQAPNSASASSKDNPWGKGGKSGKGGQSKKQQKKGKQSFIPLPKELQGFSPTLGGKRICYAFNLDGCHGGNNCVKGLHACMRCGASDHGQRSKACPKK